MADDAIGAINKAETLAIVAGVIVIGYVLYNSWAEFQAWLDKLTGASPENTLANAAAQTMQHPVTTVGTITGGWWDDVFGTPSTNVPTQVGNAAAYQKIGTSGQAWNCTGPQGASNDMCYPVTLDGSGNPTITGAAVHAIAAN